MNAFAWLLLFSHSPSPSLLPPMSGALSTLSPRIPRPIWYSPSSPLPSALSNPARQAHPCLPHHPPMAPPPRPKQWRHARQRRLPCLNTSNLPALLPHLASPRVSYPRALSSPHSLKARRGMHPLVGNGIISGHRVLRSGQATERAAGGAYGAPFYCSSGPWHALTWSSLLSCSFAS